MKIAEASVQSEISIDTLRFYEKEGLISPARSSGQRIYSDADLDTLDTIARFRRLGVSIAEIRQLLLIEHSIGDLASISPDEVVRIREVQSILNDHSSRLETRISEMQGTLSAFQTMNSKLTHLLEAGGLENESQ